MAFKTIVVVGRNTTSTEATLLEKQLAECVDQQTTDGTRTMTDMNFPETRTTTRVWTTEAAANSWVAFMNSFVPGPVSAIVVNE